MKKLYLLLILLLSFQLVSAVDNIWLGNQDGRYIYGVKNASFVQGNISNFTKYYGDGSALTGISGSGGSDGNNYTTSISFDGTNTKTLTLNRSGMSSLTASFTDIDTTYTNDTGLILTGNIFSLNTVYTNSLYYLLTNPQQFVNLTGVVASIGNWSNDKSSYNTTSTLMSIFYNQSYINANFYTLNNGNSLVTNLSNVNNSLSNQITLRIADNTTQSNQINSLNTNIGGVQTNVTNLNTSLTTLINTKVAGFTANCSSGYVLYSVNLTNGSWVCVVDQTGGAGGGFNDATEPALFNNSLIISLNETYVNSKWNDTVYIDNKASSLATNISNVNSSLTNEISLQSANNVTQSNQINNLNTNIGSVQTNISNLNTSLTTRDNNLQVNITMLVANNISLYAQTSSLQTNITNLNTSLTAKDTALQSDNTTQSTQINNIQSNVNSAQTNITNLNSSLTTSISTKVTKFDINCSSGFFPQQINLTNQSWICVADQTGAGSGFNTANTPGIYNQSLTIFLNDTYVNSKWNDSITFASECPAGNTWTSMPNGSNQICKSLNESLINISRLNYVSTAAGWTNVSDNTKTVKNVNITVDNSINNPAPALSVSKVNYDIGASSSYKNVQNILNLGVINTSKYYYALTNSIDASIPTVTPQPNPKLITVGNDIYLDTNRNYSYISSTDDTVTLNVDTNVTTLWLHDSYVTSINRGRITDLIYYHIGGNDNNVLLSRNTNITNSYGIYIENQSRVNTSNSYAIYTNNGRVRFGDNLSIIPLAQASCDVKANETTGQLYCGTDATGGSGGFSSDQATNITSNVTFKNINGNMISAVEFNGSINYTNIQNYPVAPGNGYCAANISSTITYVRVALNGLGDNVSFYNATITTNLSVNDTLTVTNKIVTYETKRYCMNSGCTSYMMNNGTGVIIV